MTVCKVQQVDGLDPQRLVAVAYARGNQDFPGTKTADIQRINQAKSLGMAAQIAEKNLKHARDGSPKIGLLRMVVNGFDRSGIGKRKRDLNISCTVGHHAGSKSFSEARQLSEETTVIRVNLQRLNADAFDQIGRIRFGNYFAQSFFRARADSQLDA